MREAQQLVKALLEDGESARDFLRRHAGPPPKKVFYQTTLHVKDWWSGDRTYADGPIYVNPAYVIIRAIPNDDTICVITVEAQYRDPAENMWRGSDFTADTGAVLRVDFQERYERLKKGAYSSLVHKMKDPANAE